MYDRYMIPSISKYLKYYLHCIIIIFQTFSENYNCRKQYIYLWFWWSTTYCYKFTCYFFLLEAYCLKKQIQNRHILTQILDQNSWELIIIDLMSILKYIAIVTTSKFNTTTLYNNWIFLLRISSENATCKFGHIYWRNP